MTKIVIEISDDDYESIKRGMRYKDTIADIMQQIEDAESVLSSSENPNKWIPVETALPEVGQRVIATVKSIDGNYVRETICGKYGLLCGNGIAWMPLPEPYKTESEVK